MSTLEPRPPYSDTELAAFYPPQLRLQLVQVLLRHGERTPVTPRFANAGLPAFWPYCRAVRLLTSGILTSGPDQPFTALEWKRRLETFGHDDTPVPAAGRNGELDAVCDAGMLTDRGRETTLALGERLRRLYVDQLDFLPPTLDSDAAAESLYLRATPIPRALDSLQQTFHGLYPPHARAPHLSPFTIISRPIADETLFPNDSNCRRFAALARAFANRAAVRWNDSDEMAYLTRKVGKWMPDSGPGVVAVDAHPRLSGLMDTINATAAHGPATKLPGEFYDARLRSIIDAISVEEWFAGYKESREYRTLGIGGLLGDVVERMVRSAEKATPSPVRFGLSGCHDTTLAAALTSLGAFEGEKWPPFTSHIAIELFRHAEQPEPMPAAAPATKSWLSSIFSRGSSGAAPGIGRKETTVLSDAEKQKLGGYYVRLRYNDRPMSVPGCAAAGKHLEGDESFCTLVSASPSACSSNLGLTLSKEAFKAIVDKFTPKNWKQECLTDIKAPAFPAKPEPAGV